MNLQENIQRIKEVMMILEENITLPLTLSGAFNGENGDQLHAFQSTNGVEIGGMQTKVNEKLKEIINAGLKPEITDVKATIDTTKNQTSWEVTIGNSKDGIAYSGLITRGSCCNSTYQFRATKQIPEMKTKNPTYKNYKLIKILSSTSDGQSNGNLTIIGGPYWLHQYFYQYTL
jgi:hypothetical protein